MFRFRSMKAMAFNLESMRKFSGSVNALVNFVKLKAINFVNHLLNF